jgi:hypothetical protein
MRFLKKTASANDISTGGGKKPPVKKADFYWPLELAALKNASANSSRTATIELLCTSDVICCEVLLACHAHCIIHLVF